MIFYTLYEIVSYLISVIIMLVIVQFVLSLLITFNVISMHNGFVSALWRGINALLDPVLRPIRKLLPHTGALDLSALVLIVGLKILSIVLRNLAIGSLA